MRTVEVLFWRDAPRNPKGVPGEWPARVEVPTGRGAPWVRMSLAELDAAKENARAAFDAWKAARPKPNPVVPDEIVAEDGSRWVLDAAGVPRKAGR